jgi:sterol desaturase/sphingolipid hydroxylase (fatty acid hydroxylase superfamily)
VARRERSPRLGRELAGWISGSLIVAAGALILWLERRRPLRPVRQDKVRRDLRNLALSAGTIAAIRFTEKPLTDRLSTLVHEKGAGIVPALRLPVWLEVLLAAVLLDYTLYVWHVLTHRVRFLWRFHRVHHADLELDASTALRFHFAEMALSAPWRAAQVAVIGAAPLSLTTWQTATLVAILFHHSNIELPPRVERWLARLVMTPRMHGIHHSIVREETDSNWSTILSFPDWLHGTHRLDVPQAEVVIGVPEYRDPGELTLGKLLSMPFGEQRPTSRLSEGTISERPRLSAVPRSQLLS